MPSCFRLIPGLEEEVIARAPDFPGADVNLARLLAGSGRHVEAVRVLEERIRQALGGDQAAGYLIAMKYLESLEKIADGQATKVFLPIEASGVLGSLGSMREIWGEVGKNLEE